MSDLSPPPGRPPPGNEIGAVVVAVALIFGLLVVANQLFGPWVDLGRLVPRGASVGGATSPPNPPPRGGEIPEGVDPAVAQTICRVARDLRANDKVILSAYEAAIVESGVRNINYGDRDSLGVFQQRPSKGWGTPAQIMDPAYAAREYIKRAIVSDRRNPKLTPGLLAQSVQRSAFPERYDQREGQARALVQRYCK